MKRVIYFLPLIFISLLSFKQPVRNQAAAGKFIIITGCFTNNDVYVEVDYSTGMSSITDVRAFSAYYPYTEYTVTSYPYTDAWYSAGHVYVDSLTVVYSIPTGGGGYTYPPSTMLGNDCGL